MSNPLKSLLDSICALSKIASILFPYLPFIYSFTTVIFICLGIAGVIAFAAGSKFKNAARNIYGFVHFITRFISMLILFHISYCSLIIPTNPSNPSREVSPNDEDTQYKPNYMKIKNNSQEGGGIKNSILKLISKMFDLINTIIENNSMPFIIIQVLCSSLIVIVLTFISAIFSGIAKAGYQMHCVQSKEVLSVPGLGNLVDFFMHLLLVGSSFLFILSFFWKWLKDGVVAGYNFVFSGNKKSLTVDEIINTPVVNMNSDASEIISQVTMFMKELPIMKAVFIISLSYYISQLFLRGFEDIISNNIVLLTSWTTRETECSDEPNKKSKTDIERGFVLFGNILLFIVLVLITLVLVFVNIAYFTLISKALSMGLNMYIPGAVAVSVKLSYDTIKKTLARVSNKIPGGVDINTIEREVSSEIEKYVDTNGNIKPDAIESMLKEIANNSNGPGDPYSDGIIKKKKKPPHQNIGEDERTRNERSSLDESHEEAFNRNKTNLSSKSQPANTKELSPSTETQTAPVSAPDTVSAPASAPEPPAPAPSPEPPVPP